MITGKGKSAKGPSLKSQSTQKEGQPEVKDQYTKLVQKFMKDQKKR